MILFLSQILDPILQHHDSGNQFYKWGSTDTTGTVNTRALKSDGCARRSPPAVKQTLRRFLTESSVSTPAIVTIKNTFGEFQFTFTRELNIQIMEKY